MDSFHLQYTSRRLTSLANVPSQVLLWVLLLILLNEQRDEE